MINVITYQLAYNPNVTVDLCRGCADRGDHGAGVLGPVSHGAHRGECEGAKHEDRPRSYLVTEYSVSIKTAPHSDWVCPVGWGPYYTRDEAERAEAKADKLWMATRIVETKERRELTASEARRLGQAGATVAPLGGGRS